MAYHPKWLPKYREYYKPKYFDNVYRRWDSKMKNSSHTYKTQDPLHFDHNLEHTNGGVALLVEYLHDKSHYHLPLKNKAHLMYNMAKKGIYDPAVYDAFEA